MTIDGQIFCIQILSFIFKLGSDIRTLVYVHPKNTGVDTRVVMT